MRIMQTLPNRMPDLSLEVMGPVSLHYGAFANMSLRPGIRRRVVIVMLLVSVYIICAASEVGRTETVSGQAWLLAALWDSRMALATAVPRSRAARLGILYGSSAWIFLPAVPAKTFFLHFASSPVLSILCA